MALGIVSHWICRIALFYLETYNCVLKTDIGIKQMRARLVNLSQKKHLQFANFPTTKMTSIYWNRLWRHLSYGQMHFIYLPWTFFLIADEKFDLMSVRFSFTFWFTYWFGLCDTEGEVWMDETKYNWIYLSPTRITKLNRFTSNFFTVHKQWILCA